jgi:hypothetical protein
MLEVQITIQAASFDAACAALAERDRAEVLKRQLQGSVAVRLSGECFSAVWLQKAKP